MKEAYYTLGTIESNALAFRRDLERHVRIKSLSYLPQHSALLVLDMQSYFLDARSHAFIPSAPAIIPGILALIRAFSARNIPVVFTQHLNSYQDAGAMGTWWRELITAENPLSAIIPEFDLSTGFVLSKTQYDAFHCTPLEKILCTQGVTQVVVSGVMTHLCCESTARSAFVRGFEVFFPIDATATYNRSFHQATLLNLAHGFACLTLVKDLLAEMKDADAS